MAKSKFFRVAVEGATTDGRTIERSWIQDMADTYNPSTYGARVNLEHIRGIIPDSPFKAYGDVTAAKAEEITEGALKGKLALSVQIDPTPDMVALIKLRQKIYPSIEVQPKFASTSKAYLVGLAVTDSPASLGTDMLNFAAQHPEKNPLASRKQAPDNLFSAATDAVEIELEEDTSDVQTSTLFKSVKEALAKLTGKSKSSDANFAEIQETLTNMVGVLQEFSTSATAATQSAVDQFAAITRRLDAIEAASKKTDTDFDDLRTQLSAMPANPKRQLTNGSGNEQWTNC